MRMPEHLECNMSKCHIRIGRTWWSRVVRAWITYTHWQKQYQLHLPAGQKIRLRTCPYLRGRRISLISNLFLILYLFTEWERISIRFVLPNRCRPAVFILRVPWSGQLKRHSDIDDWQVHQACNRGDGGCEAPSKPKLYWKRVPPPPPSLSPVLPLCVTFKAIGLVLFGFVVQINKCGRPLGHASFLPLLRFFLPHQWLLRAQIQAIERSNNIICKTGLLIVVK